MKRVKVVLVSLLIACMLLACEKKSASDNVSESDANTESIDESDKTEGEKEESGILGGVYQDGDELVAVPMGTIVMESQKKICSVQVPQNYMIYGLYMEDANNFSNYEDAYNVLVKEAVKNDAWESDIAMAGCKLSSTNGDPVTGMDIYVQECSFEEVVPVSDCVELEDCKYRTFYCESPEVCMDSDISIYIMVSDNVVILVNYTGPLYDSLGAEQLSKNVYNLFEISY